MAITTAGKNLALDALAAAITHIGLSNNGTEVTGGSYARQAVAWGSAASGEVAMTGTETFSVPGSNTVDSVDGWSASSAGTKYVEAAITDEVFGSDGELDVNSYTLTMTDPA